MAKNLYKVSSHPSMTDLQLQKLLRHLSEDGGPHLITHILIDPARPNAERVIIVRLPDAKPT